MSYSVYGYGKDYDSLLLVNSSFWVINGDWQLEKENGVFIHPLNKTPLNIKLLGYIDYDGDYNSTLERFRRGEGKHIADEVQLVIPAAAPTPELCKRKYYGIECSCSKCKR